MRYGYFDNENREYVINRVDTPVSWTNYIGTKDMCGVLNQTAGGYLFSGASEYHRITRFRGSAVQKPGLGNQRNEKWKILRSKTSGIFWRFRRIRMENSIIDDLDQLSSNIAQQNIL